jgi:hypothetical protein
MSHLVYREKGMNWEAMGAVGELLSAVVVIASVIYLGIQIRENTRVSRNEAYRDMVDIWNVLLKTLANADSQAVVKALASYETLESHEKFNFDNLMTMLVNTLEGTAEVNDENFIIDDVMEPVEGYVAHYFTYPGTHEWWRRSKGGFTPKIQGWIDRKFPGPDPDADYWGIYRPAGE